MINKNVMYNFFINLNDSLKISIFIKNHSKRHIQSKKNSKIFARSLCSRLLGVISAFININIDLRISKTRKSNKQNTSNLTFVNEIAKNGCFVVKRYAVREVKTWRYAVHKAEIRRHAVRKRVSPSWKWIVVHVLSFSGFGFQIKYIVTNVRKQQLFV